MCVYSAHTPPPNPTDYGYGAGGGGAPGYCYTVHGNEAKSSKEMCFSLPPNLERKGLILVVVWFPYLRKTKRFPIRENSNATHFGAFK